MKQSISKPALLKPNGMGVFKLSLLENTVPKLEHSFKGIHFSRQSIAGVDSGPDYYLSFISTDGSPFIEKEYDVGPQAMCYSQITVKDKVKIDAFAESGHVTFKEVSRTRMTGSYSCTYSFNELTYEASGEFDITPGK